MFGYFCETQEKVKILYRLYEIWPGPIKKAEELDTTSPSIGSLVRTRTSTSVTLLDSYTPFQESWLLIFPLVSKIYTVLSTLHSYLILYLICRCYYIMLRPCSAQICKWGCYIGCLVGLDVTDIDDRMIVDGRHKQGT